MSNEECGSLFSSDVPPPSSSIGPDPILEPLDTTLPISQLCFDGLSPRRLEGVFIQLLISHFSCPEAIYSKSLSDKIWTSDPRTTKIWITTVSRWDPRATAIRPALIVKRKPFSQQRLGINDSQGLDEAGNAAYARKVSGGHQILCVGRSGPEAEDLAYEVEEFFTCFGINIARDFRFEDFECEGSGELTPLEEDKTNFVIPVGLKYSYWWRWSVVKVGRKMKSVSLNFTTM